MKGFFVRVYAGLALVILVSIAIFTRMGTSEWPELASHMKRISGISAESLEERLEGADAPIGEDIRLSSELDLEIKLLPEGGDDFTRRRVASGHRLRITSRRATRQRADYLRGHPNKAARRRGAVTAPPSPPRPMPSPASDLTDTGGRDRRSLPADPVSGTSTGRTYRGR